MISSPISLGRVVSYLILVGISHISMPCSMYNNVAETWPQYLSPVTFPQLLALRCLSPPADLE